MSVSGIKLRFSAQTTSGMNYRSLGIHPWCGSEIKLLFCFCISIMRLILLLWLLYFLQGIPYGFQTKFLPVFLRKFSLSLTVISFTRLLSLPWLLKPLWAPFVDKYGSVISWIKYNLLGMALCYLVASCIPINSVTSVVIIMAFLNIMAATEDIAVDSLFVNHLTPESIGKLVQIYFMLFP